MEIDLKKIGTWIGLIGGSIAVFTLLVDWRVSQLEARMVDRFALLREINDIKDDVVGIEDRIDRYHIPIGPIGRPDARLAPEALSK